ncbi:MAG: DMT family transporter [Clostridia bacterium]|nr:DMT family transporter [Clostridia bacterium]
MPARLKYIAAMLIFGSVGLPVRWLPLPSGWIALLRGVIGCLFLLALRRPEPAAFKRNWIPLLISGTAIGLNWIFLFEAYRYTTVAVATLMYYLAPVLVLLLLPYVLKEKLTLKRWLTVGAALVGMAFVSGVVPYGKLSGSRGIAMGFLAACFYAAVMLANRFFKDINGMDRTVYQLAIAALAVLPYALLREGFSVAWFDWRSVLLLLLLGIVYTGFAYWLYFDGLGQLPGQSAAILSYIDPVAALLLSAAVLGERMSLWQLLGAALILGALLLNEIKIKVFRRHS